MTNNEMLKSWLILMLGVLLLGCSEQGNSSIPKSPTEQIQRQPLESPAQMSLEQTTQISVKAIIAGQEIQMEVAQTPQQQAIGLMYRKSLAANRGMLFPFNPPQPVNFWMKNTLIPLDMVFLRDGVVRNIARNVPPCASDPCPTYGPKTTVIDQVIELRGGRSTELGLKVGDRVTIQRLDASTSYSNLSHK